MSHIRQCVKWKAFGKPRVFKTNLLVLSFSRCIYGYIFARAGSLKYIYCVWGCLGAFWGGFVQLAGCVPEKKRPEKTSQNWKEEAFCLLAAFMLLFSLNKNYTRAYESITLESLLSWFRAVKKQANDLKRQVQKFGQVGCRRLPNYLMVRPSNVNTCNLIKKLIQESIFYTIYWYLSGCVHCSRAVQIIVKCS